MSHAFSNTNHRILPKNSFVRKIIAGTLAFLLLASSTVTPFVEQAGARYLSTTVVPGEFKTARKGFTANLITTGPNKGQILVAGGFDGTNYLDTAERFNPATGAFVPLHATLGKMSKKRAYHSSVSLPDGKILLIGGYESVTTLLGAMEIYDPNTDRFTLRNGLADLPALVTPRAYHTSTVVPDPLDPASSIILIAGGYTGTAYTNKAETFTLATNSVASTANDMLTARGYHTASYFPATGTSSKGTVLMIGGTNDVTSGMPVAKGAQEYYDVSTRQFMAAGISMTDARVGHTVVDFSTTTTPNLLVTGGQKSATQYSDTADRITHNGTNFTLTPIVTRMSTPRKGAMSVSATQDSNTLNRKVYIIGGNNGGMDLKSFETFDTATNVFEAVSGDVLATARVNAQIIKMPLLSAEGGLNNNSQIFIIGGSNSAYPIIRSSEFLDVQAYQITPSVMKFARSDFKSIEITDDQAAGSHYTNYGKVLIIGGKKSGTTFRDGNGVFEAELYDPSQNTFTDLCLEGRNSSTGRCNNPARELGVGRYHFTATQLSNGKVIIMGGKNESGLVNTVEIFDPQTATFSSVTPSISLGRFGHQATLISPDEILVTGGTTGAFSGAGACRGENNMQLMTTAYIYKISTQSFTDKWNGVNAIGTHVGRAGHIAKFIGGKVYLVGGGTTSIDEYNPANGTFTTASTSGPAAGFFTDGFAYQNQSNADKIFVYGGSSSMQRVGTYTGSYCNDYVYTSYPNGSKNTASIISLNPVSVSNITLPASFASSAHTKLANNQYFIAGAFSYGGTGARTANADSTTGYIFDPATETFYPQSGSMKSAHGGHQMLTLSDKLSLINKGKVLILGGLDGTTAETPINKAELFDPGNFTPDTPDDDTGFFVPQNNQEFTSHQPSFKFYTSDIEGDHLKYQVQITDRLLSFPFDDFEVTNEASFLWNFVQGDDQTGFKGMDGFDGQYFKNNTVAELDLSSTSFFLPNGEYKVRVRAIDPTGSHTYSPWGPSNAGGQYNFTINAEEGIPTVSITNPQNQIYNSTSGLLPFLGTAVDDGVASTGVKKVMVTLKDETSNTWWNDASGFTMPSETYFEATGTANWNYPRSGTVTFTDGHNYSIKAYAVDNAGNVGNTGTPVNFTYDSAFVPMNLVLTSPNGGENLGVGTPYTITWTASNGVADHFELSYSKDNFATETSIDTNVSGALNSYTWMTPADVSTTVKIRILAKNANSQTLGTDTSDANFQISTNGGDSTAPTVNFLSPVDGGNVNSLSSLNGTYTDGGSISSITVSIKNKTTGKYYDGAGFNASTEANQTISTLTSPWTYSTTNVPFEDETEYEIKAYVTDMGSNEGVKTISVGYNMPSGNVNTNATNTNTNNANTNTGTGNTNQNTANVNTNTGSGNTNTNTSGGTTNVNTNTGTVNTNTNSGGGTTIIISNPSGGGGGSGFVYPIYPTIPSTVGGTQGTQSTNTNNTDHSAPETTITYPPNGATVQTLSSIQGTADDGNGGSGISYILVSFYDETSGKYFDGARFGGNEKTEFRANGDSVWSLEIPQIFESGHMYTVAVRAVDKAGNSQTLPTQTKITYGGAGSSQSQPQQTTTSTTEPINTNSGSTTNPGITQEQLAEMIRAVQNAANKPQPPVNVQVTAPRTTSTPAATTTPSQSTSSATGTTNTSAANQNVNSTPATPDSNYDDAYNQYIAAHPEAKVTDPAYDTMGMRDSDNDGLSDQLELKIGTDPFKRDTDGDSFSDGEEVLEYATNPLDPNDKPGLRGISITNLDTGNTTPDQRPFITGFAKPGSKVVLYDIKPDGTKREVGSATADSRGRYVVTPTSELEAGKHFLAAGILDSEGKVIDMSSVKTLEVDPTLEVPVPEVQDIKVMNLKPHVFGKTLYGTTVVGQFQSLITTSSIIADTTTGDFVVAAAAALEKGQHKVTLYAIMPNGVRSKSVTVPFTVGENDTTLRQSALKADLTSAGGNVWWLLAALLPLLLLAVAAIWYLLQKKDTVVYSLNKKELSNIEFSKVGEAFTFVSKFPVHTKDLKTEYIAFHLSREMDEKTEFKILKDATQGTLVLFGKILDMKYLDSTANNAEISLSSLDQKHLERYYIKYCFEQISIDPKALPEFTGKKYMNSAKLINDVAFVESTAS